MDKEKFDLAIWKLWIIETKLRGKKHILLADELHDASMSLKEAAQHNVDRTSGCCCDKHYPGRLVRCLQCPIHGFDPTPGQ